MEGCDVPSRVLKPLFHDSHRLLGRESPHTVWGLTFHHSEGTVLEPAIWTCWALDLSFHLSGSNCILVGIVAV